MPKIRVAVIGVGYLGKFHAEKYARMANVQLAGVVDIRRSRAEDVAAMHGTRAYTDYRDLCGAVDAVSIAVPTAAHFARVRLATLERAIHSTGFFRHKAKNIRTACQRLVTRHGGQVPPDLDRLAIGLR